MTVPTNVRAGRSTALYAAYQSAKGTPAADLTASGATRLWTEDSAIWAGPDVSVSAYMDDPLDDSIHVSPDKPEGSFRTIGTYSSLKWLLQSNYGAMSGTTFSPATGIADTRWLTLVHVEDRFGAGTVTRKLVRLQDCWVHRLIFEWDATANKYLSIRADYAGRKVLTQAQNAGGITFPTAPMQPSDRVLYPTANTVLIRRDGLSNIFYRYRSVRVTIDQGLGLDWDMGTDMYSIYKAGPIKAEIEFTTDWSDQTWALLDLARAGTDAIYVVSSKAEDGSTFSIDLYGVVLKVDPNAVRGQEHGPFHAKGMASEVTGDIVVLLLT